MSFEARGSIVLGATSGIGQRIAHRLARAGSALLLTYFRSEDRAIELGKSIDGPTELIQADVTKKDQLETVLSRAKEHLPALDLVVNVVGESHGLSLERTTYEKWRETIDLNLYGTFLSAQIFGLHMKQSGGGALVNISSVAGIRPSARGHDYVAAKAGIFGLTRSLALELAPEVTVNSIAPGWISTDRRPRSMEGHEEILSRIPLSRFGTPDDLVDAALLLGKPRGYITGQTIIIDGGYTL
ncbi:SDR family NAD(P)-dependent oxidoreductase [Bradyrhizobium sp. HKCCYLRH1062]|uniref:SDR family NAD(P)-dependent oxidoreductase n=1 Tax=unclassified Bradyrhizobium TaxID=2631580 RepID=UPI003EC02C1F